MVTSAMDSVKMVPNALTESLQMLQSNLRYLGTFVRTTTNNVVSIEPSSGWVLLKLPNSLFLGFKSMIVQFINVLVRQVNGIRSILDIKKMFRIVYVALFETHLLQNVSSTWLKLRNGLFFGVKSMVAKSSHLLFRHLKSMQSNIWWLLDIRNVFGWTYHVLFETYLLQNISCALLLGACVCLYLATDTEKGSVPDEDQLLQHDVIPRPSSSTPKNKTTKSPVSLSMADHSKRRDADFSFFAYTKAKLFPSVSSPMNNIQQFKQMANDTIALRTPQRSYSQASSPSTATSSPYRNNPSSSSSINSSPGGLSSIVYSHGSDDDDDDLSMDDQGMRSSGGGHGQNSEENKGKHPSGRDLSHQSTIIKESATNPSVLIGWQINIRHKGLGLVLGIKKRMGRATLFRVQMDSGEVQMLSLKRSNTKGDLPFIPVTRL